MEDGGQTLGDVDPDLNTKINKRISDFLSRQQGVIGGSGGMKRKATDKNSL